ncbi:MAG: hypothetical protein RM368_19915 [Nostoc sp. DedSLP03]|uniref:hypothetical protein n=1 Tax=Nostoc sp. DedSLP03 TaxID=3075400 RepID=UPI002AD52D3B|nr:hypothetical protein [Nostoc sp. DedSLP03]MDZ7967209.1 hypothetical protein [Nostoc sp. DedSLP03]
MEKRQGRQGRGERQERLVPLVSSAPLLLCSLFFQYLIANIFAILVEVIAKVKGKRENFYF